VIQRVIAFRILIQLSQPLDGLARDKLNKLKEIGEEIRKSFRPIGDLYAVHPLIEQLIWNQLWIVPAAAPRDRYELAKTTINMIDAYLEKDESPRRLFVARAVSERTESPWDSRIG
jgi:hypothetical protein